jgi:RHS repeat-associated protein
VAQNYKFTGKERDSESGLDNFGARYDASSLGRFMTPDWAAKPISVPYAKFGDPQTLNLYAYVENSPLNRIDADGHDSPGQMCPDCISQSQTESQVSDTNSGAAATTSAQASRANTAQDTSQQQTSQTTSNTSTSSDPIVNALEKVPGVADATPTANQPNPAATGGHRNETDTVTFKSPEEKAKFLAESGRKHTIPGDVSENGFGPGVRLPGGLHSEKGHLDAQGNLVVTSHIDRFNPNNGLAPLVGHIVWDVGVGMTFFRHSASLD